MEQNFVIDNHTPEQALLFLKSLAMGAQGGTLQQALTVIQAVEAAAATITHEFEKSKPKEK